MNKKVLIIGASSGIGKELAVQYSKLTYDVIITARNTEELTKTTQNNKNISYEYMDINNTQEAIETLKRLIIDTDITIICAGIGYINKDLDFSLEDETISTNVKGFTAMATEAFNCYNSANKGHIVAISSIASLRGSDLAPAYNASKAYISNYMDGLRKKSIKENLNIKITTVLSGLVDTKMAKGEGLFWVEPVELISKEIIEGINKNKTNLVVSKRWNFITLLLKILPDFLYYKL